MFSAFVEHADTNSNDPSAVSIIVCLMYDVSLCLLSLISVRMMGVLIFVGIKQYWCYEA